LNNQFYQIFMETSL